MNPRYTILSIVLIFLHCTCRSAEPIDTVLSDHISKWQMIPKEIQANPVFHGEAHQTSLSEVYARIDFSKQTEPFVLQKGDGFLLPKAAVNTFLKLSRETSVWGAASYKFGKKRNIIWNSTSDYDRLAPYVLADTIGGDTQYEEYRFQGGYQTQLGKLSLGTEALFRASHEYRQIDPRMRGIVTDLTLRLGASYDIHGYQWGAMLEGNLYKQTNDVDFYRELGVIPEYQMTGLGNEYSRFSGDKRTLYYNGSGISLQLSGLPRSRNGVYTNMLITQSKYRRVLAELNSMPLTDLWYHIAHLNIGWRKRGRKDLDIFATAHYTKCSGDEYIAGKSSSRYFPVIGKLTMYKKNILDASLSGTYGSRYTSGEWHSTLRAGINTQKEEYVYPSRKIEFTHAFAHLEGQMIQHLSSPLTLSLDINISYERGIDSNIKMPYANMSKDIIYMINHTYTYAKASYTSSHAIARLDYQLKHSNIGLFTSFGGGVVMCSENESQTDLHLAMGITF